MAKENFYLGEKIETLIYRRVSGSLGDYLGATANVFGAVKIDGIVYHVERNIETNINWFWRVKNINTGNSIELKDQYDLPILATV